jgi:hypothetical protein
LAGAPLILLRRSAPCCWTSGFSIRSNRVAEQLLPEPSSR